MQDQVDYVLRNRYTCRCGGRVIKSGREGRVVLV